MRLKIIYGEETWFFVYMRCVLFVLFVLFVHVKSFGKKIKEV